VGYRRFKGGLFGELTQGKRDEENDQGNQEFGDQFGLCYTFHCVYVAPVLGAAGKPFAWLVAKGFLFDDALIITALFHFVNYKM
jgi:hypothetical protein